MDVDVVARWASCEDLVVTEARLLATGALAGFGVADEVLADAGLMVSELVANAASHGRCPVELMAWRCRGECAVIEVHDAALTVPELPYGVAVGDIDVMAESGRGLALVTALSERVCGAALLPTHRAKATWFAVPLAESTSTGGACWAARVRTWVQSRLYLRDVLHHPESFLRASARPCLN